MLIAVLPCSIYLDFKPGRISNSNEAMRLLPQTFVFQAALLLPGDVWWNSGVLLPVAVRYLSKKPAAPPPAAGFFVWTCKANPGYGCPAVGENTSDSPCP